MSRSRGRSWIITHVANGSYLTFIMFQKHGFDVDECHFTSDAAVVYTYVHFREPVRISSINIFLDAMKSDMKITLFEVFGYDSVTTAGDGYDLTDHVGFKILLNHHITDNDLFISCTDGQPGIKRGLLWTHHSIARIKDAVNHRSKALGKYFEEMEKELAEYKQKASMVDLL